MISATITRIPNHSYTISDMPCNTDTEHTSIILLSFLIGVDMPDALDLEGGPTDRKGH